MILIVALAEVVARRRSTRQSSLSQLKRPNHARRQFPQGREVGGHQNSNSIIRMSALNRGIQSMSAKGTRRSSWTSE